MLRYIVCILLYLIVVNPTSDYGEFDLSVKAYEQCKGPKRRNCVNATTTIVGNSSVAYDIVITEPMQVIKGKITSTLNNRELLRLQVRDVCDNVFLKTLLQNQFRTDKCGLAKGTYLFTVDIQALARKFYGGRFMYGNWTSKVLFYSNYCNMHCGILHILLTPQKSNNS